MELDLKYPVKYAILELKQNGGWINNYEKITQGFIVSKCYVMDSNIKFFSDGKSEESYKVVFPFSNNPNTELSLKHIISNPNPTRAIDGTCFSSDTVSDLFDTYEEANALALKKNKELETKLVLEISIWDPFWKEKKQKTKEQFSKKMELCHEIENWILNHTSYMKISRLIDLKFIEKQIKQEQSGPVLVKKKTPPKK